MTVTIPSAVKSNLLSLQSISSQAQTSQNILSTGKKVNSALDNATSFFTASSLNTRASSLSGLLDSVSNGIQTIQAANTGITSITKPVDQLKSTAKQALSSASAYTSQANYSTSAVTGATASDLRGAGTAATVKGTALTVSSAPATGAAALNASGIGLAAGETIIVNGSTLNITTASTGTSDADNIKADDTVTNLLSKIAAKAGSGATATIGADGKISVTAGDTSTAVTLGGTGLSKLGLSSGTTAAGSGPGALDGKTLTFTVGTGAPLAVKFGDPATTTGAVKSLDDLNSKLSTVGLSGAVDATGKLTFSTTSATASKTFKVKSDVAVAGVTTSDVTSSAPSRGGAGADSRDAIVTQYNGLLDQINTLAKDSSFNGLNLLQGDTLSLVFNETNTSKLSVTGSDSSFSGLGLSKVTAADFNDGDGINSVLTALTNSSTNLASSASKLGTNLAVVQTRQDFTKNLSNTLTTGADNLVNADLNEEATKLLALNTSASLAQQALSLANQSSQGVLQLLR